MAKTAKINKKEEEIIEALPGSEISDMSHWTIHDIYSEKAHYDNSLNNKILNHILKLGLITNEQKTSIINYHRKNKENLADSLVNLGIMKEADAGLAIADYFKISYVNLKNTHISSETAFIIPEKVAQSEGVLAYLQDDQYIYVAMVNPTDQHFLHLLEKKTGKRAVARYATPGVIKEAQYIYRQNVLGGLDHLLERATADIDKLESLNNISSIFDTIVLMAFYRKSSDIHIEPFENEIRIRLRVDGVLSSIAKLPTRFLETMVNHVKVLAKLRTDEHSSSQDGRFKAKFDNAVINFRVSILPSYYGEKMVLRLLSSESQEMSLEELGYTEKDIHIIQRNINKTQGMNLITGPTGSGKTTTLYSLLTGLNNEDVNISTIEDPIEYGLYGVNQVQVNPKTNLTFADGLRTLLRQDPDIIMIGEIRDLETGKISAHSALTGHLIFATLHTNNAALAPLRLIQMGVDPYLIVSTLNMIIAQRLTRTVCTSCKLTYKLSAKEIQEIENKFFTSDKQRDLFRTYFNSEKGSGSRLYKGKGCDECGNSGYRGRSVVSEVMELNQEIRDLITAEASGTKIEEAAVKNGMTTMLEDGLNKVINGKTTLDELFRVINQ